MCHHKKQRGSMTITVCAPISHLSDLPPAHLLLGTEGQAHIAQQISESYGITSYGDRAKHRFATSEDAFFKFLRKPYDEIKIKLSAIRNKLILPDRYRPLETHADLGAAPPCMHIPILSLKPVHDLFKKGLISGYGYDISDVPEDLPYERLATNGYIPNILEAEADEDGYIALKYEWHDDDPELDEEEIYALNVTRHMIERLIESTKLDPTDPTNERG
jgi:hypothetical protein